MPNAFCHIELNTDDIAHAKKFYKSVFAWKLNDMKGMPYTMIDVGKGVGGGMQPKMPNAPTAWLPYVEVDSIKTTIAKARKAGATIALEYMAMGANGAIGVFMDPSGAAVGIWEPAKKTAPKKSAAKKTVKKATKKR